MKVKDCAFQDGSYPCGYKDGDKLPDCELCFKVRKAGIREVVEWIDGISKAGQPSKFIPSSEWQDQLKTWGVE